MRSFPLMIAAAALAAASLADAQPGPRGPAWAASGASAPYGGRMGGPGMMGRRFGPDNTAGWGLMTPAERSAHRDKMHSFKTEGECRAYVDEQHRLMGERAKERGRSLPAQPRHDPCAGLPK